MFKLLFFVVTYGLRRIDNLLRLCYTQAPESKESWSGKVSAGVKLYGTREGVRMKSRLYSVRDLWPVGLLVVMNFCLGCNASSERRLQAADHYRFAQSYLANKSYALAEQEVRKALLIQSQNAEYLGFLALIYQAQGQLNAAEDAYRLAVQQAEIPPSVLVNYSTLLLLLNRDEEAISHARRALQSPGYDKPARAYTNIGLGYLRQGAAQHAVEYFQKALQYQPSLPEIYHNLGLAYEQLGRRIEAIRAFREAVRLRPNYAAAYAGLGQVLLAEGRTEEAREAFKRVIDLAPDSNMAMASQRQLKRLAP